MTFAIVLAPVRADGGSGAEARGRANARMSLVGTCRFFAENDVFFGDELREQLKMLPGEYRGRGLPRRQGCRGVLKRGRRGAA